jgi:hypothetical protein
LWLGEFGTTNSTQDIIGAAPGSEGQWFQSLVAFLGKNPDINWASWALNGEDADGLMRPDYSAPANPLKLVALNDLMAKPAPAAGMGLMAAVNAPPAPIRHNSVVQRSYPANDVQPYTPHLPASVLRPQPAYPPTNEPQEPQPAHPGT